MASFTLVFISSMINAVWFGAMVLLMSQLTSMARSGSFQRWLKRVTGVVFIGFGAKLATYRPNVQISWRAGNSGGIAIRIDHIGSTAVFGLVEKPVIDVQVTVKSLSAVSDFAENLSAYGFQNRSGACEDRPPPWEEHLKEQWRKAYFKSVRSKNGQSQIPIREAGRRNQRYALLFRDYLRSNERSRDSYGAFKLQVAELVGRPSESIGTGQYLDLKDHVFDLIADLTEKWAEENDWCVENLAQ